MNVETERDKVKKEGEREIDAVWLMGKSKQRHLAAKPARKKSSSPNDLDFDGEDGWVIVKKQRVTILVPPLPVRRKSVIPKPGPSKPEAVPVKAVNNKPIGPIETTNTRMPSADEQEKIAPLAPNRGDRITAITPPAQHFSALDKLRRLNVTMEWRKPDQTDAFRSRNMLGVLNISKTIKRPRLLCGPGSFLDGGMLLNQRLRASLLEKKLQKAGGLSRWLASIGLWQFVRIFQGKSFSNFQLVNLSMKKLKDMGADANLEDDTISHPLCPPTKNHWPPLLYSSNQPKMLMPLASRQRKKPSLGYDLAFLADKPSVERDASDCFIWAVTGSVVYSYA
ncbi:unnamed protein product [Dovyalis caffra]|uniref:SAM domain-containing protein n=1 Tax=Dovyalis caffra TaxID=77055 RepID=A0AAV1RZT3_9ROSI|nr:unnamed protein product [Dovyalis caffra]